MATIISDTQTTVDMQGNIIHQTTEERTIQKDQEPDYIKIYTRIWFDFKQFPSRYRELFLQLAIRMSYCDAMRPDRSQIVAVIGDIRKEIMEACGWKSDDALTQGLRTLCKCEAIRRTARGCYQINPEFAGKGPWRYNPKAKQGGIKDLITTLRFSDGVVDTTITYNDDDPDQDNEE